MLGRVDKRDSQGALIVIQAGICDVTFALPPENWTVLSWSFRLTFPGWERSGER